MSEVFLIKNNFLDNLGKTLKKIGVENMSGDKVALKLHMGEYGNLSYVRPPIVGRVVQTVKEAGKNIFYKLHHIDSKEIFGMGEKLGMGTEEFKIIEVGTRSRSLRLFLVI